MVITINNENDNNNKSKEDKNDVNKFDSVET